MACILYFESVVFLLLWLFEAWYSDSLLSLTLIPWFIWHPFLVYLISWYLFLSTPSTGNLFIFFLSFVINPVKVIICLPESKHRLPVGAEYSPEPHVFVSADKRKNPFSTQKNQADSSLLIVSGKITELSDILAEIGLKCSQCGLTYQIVDFGARFLLTKWAIFYSIEVLETNTYIGLLFAGLQNGNRGLQRCNSVF